MSGRFDRERREKLREKKKRREKEAKLKLLQQEQQQEEMQPKKREASPYAWREILKRKDPPEQSPPSSPELSTSSKYAKSKSPLQKMLRSRSPSSKTKVAPSSPIESKWIISSSSKPSAKTSTARRSTVVKITHESSEKQSNIPATTVNQKKAATAIDSDDDSEDDLLAYFNGEDTKKRSQETASDEESKRQSPDQDDEDDRRHSQMSHKSSWQRSSRKTSRGDSESLSEDESEGLSQRPNRRKSSTLWSDGRAGEGIVFSSEDEIEEFSEGSNRKSTGNKSSKKEVIDFSSEDESESQQGRSRERRKKSHENRQSITDRSPDGHTKPALRNLFSDEEDVQGKKRKRVLNPFTVAQQQQQSIESIAANCARPAKKADDDDLWSDMDQDVDEKKEEKPMTKKGKKRSRSKSDKSIRDSIESHHSPSPIKGGGSSFWFLPDNDQRYEITKLLKREDEEALEDFVHPEIEHPFFGPSKFEPLELGKGTKSAASVPASLSRYLAPYQKEGIRFMHKCLAAKTGTIMGDEMGLGKTVQVIGLLSALFGKTGNGKDMLRIHRRNNIIMQQREMAIREEERAHLEGRLYVQKKIDAKSLDLPSWYPVLIIVPPSVVDNWKNEFEKFSTFAAAIFSGKKAGRVEALEKLRDGRAEVLIAAKSQFQDACGARDLNEFPWKLVIIDEFHTFKNEEGKLSKHLRMLKADHRPLVLGMTGTLMQNDHHELWNLIDLVETGYLGSWEEFKQDTARAIKLGRQKGADEQTIARSIRKSAALEELLNRLFIARKKQDVVADKLTKKTVNVVLCPPSELQKRVYAHILTLPDVQHVKMATSPCDCGVNKAIFKRYFKLQSPKERVRFIRENQKNIMKRSECCYKVPINPRRNEEGQPLIDPDAVIWRMLDGHDETDDNGCIRCPYCVLFVVLDKLNKLCSHVGSLQADRSKATARRGSEDYVRFNKELEFAKVAFPPDVVEQLPGGLIRQDAVMNQHFELSGKMKKLHHLLQRYRKEGCKVLLFSYSTKTLDFIEQYVRSQNHSFLRIDGQVQPALRQDLCNRFNNERDIFVFLLSTKACGLGLNLTAANKVIIFDVEWNPSWDEQAQDRAYRLGQQNDVEVIRLVTEGTVDELYKVQLKNETLNSSEPKSRSARVFRGIQGDRQRKGELFGTENLLKFKEDGSFLADVWKSKKTDRKKNSSNEVEVHNIEDITSSLNSNQCDELLDLDAANGTVANMESQEDNVQDQNGDEDEKVCAQPRKGGDEGQDGVKKMPALPRNGQGSIGGDNVRPSRSESGERDNSKVANEEDSLYPDRGVAANPAEGDEDASDDPDVDDSNQEMPTAHAKLEAKNRHHALRQGDAESPSRRSAEPRRDEEIEVSDEEDGYIANAVNQDALYDAEQGGALYEEGDDGYDEEMGGLTQNAYDSYATMQLPENPQDGSLDDDDDDDGGNHNPDQILARLLNEQDDGVAAAQGSAGHGGRAAAVSQQQEVIQQIQAIPGVPANAAQIREAMHHVEAMASQRQVTMPVNPRALNERAQGRREAYGEGAPAESDLKSRIAIQLRPEPRDPSKGDFFRSRDARGRSDSHSDDDDAARGSRVAKKPKPCSDVDDDNGVDGGRVSKKPRMEESDSQHGGGKKSAKKKAAINLFGKTTTASKSNSKAGSGLYIPTYKKSRKKKK
ncbi:unnamed protein product [Cylindrotheca closterium]|uniref:Uncharacterized protein n=1 Tax=Cylindrotheca closterium TaxID=2856 RepID=A0AAD2FH38_9STRA|nr:unnamed protein product [Cylindrotheca closterium]